MGGGLVRSAGGWAAVRSLQKAGIFQRSDERILGNGDFVESVLSDAQERVHTCHLLVAKGVGFEDIFAAVSEMLSIQPQEIEGPSKEWAVVKARTLVCYWAVRALGFSMTAVAERLKIAIPTVSVAVKKGMRVVQKENLNLNEILNVKI